MQFQGATQPPAYLALAKWMYSTNWEWIRSWDSLLTAFWGSLAKRMYQNTATGQCSWSTMDTRPSAQTWINWDTSALRKKTASSFTHVACSSIPPTSAATAYHAQRAYYQVQVWLFSNGNLNPTDWGWKNVNEKLSPIHTDLSPAPADGLSVIRCGCKGDCSSIKCSCKSHGLDCSSSCKECKGTSCLNAGNYTSDSAE